MDGKGKPLAPRSGFADGMFLTTTWPRLCPAAVTWLLAGCASAAPVARQLPAPATAPPTIPEVRDSSFDLSVANIMRGEALVGRSPDEVRWSADSRHVYFRWREPEGTDTTTFTYRVGVADGRPERLPDDSVPVAAAIAGSWSADGRVRAVIHEGDVWVVGREGIEIRITDTVVAERQPHLSPDGSIVYFLSEGNLFAVAVSGGPLRQLTDLRAEEAPEESAREGQLGFLQEEQELLFGIVRDRIAERKREEELEESRRRVHPVFLGEGNRVTGATVSPSGSYVLVGVSSSPEPRSTMVASFVTESGYTEAVDARPKVGDEQESDRAAMLELATGELSWIDPEPLERDLGFVTVGWAPREDRALLIAIAADYKDRWIFAATPDGSTTLLDHLRDDAWVGGPELFTVGWLPDGERAYFVSEQTGFAHLYTVPVSGGEPRALTAGAWEVTDVQLPAGETRFFLTTSEAHPGERHLYSLAVDGGQRMRMTSGEGWAESTVSPDGRWAGIIHSEANRPPELFIREIGGTAPARQVTRSTTAEFRRGPWIQPEIVAITARDGVAVPARIYRPSELGAAANGAAVLFVHGAGYLQNVHRGWSSYYREYMFNHLLASLGYVVLDVDYRGSAGYGRDWRTAIHRRMGGTDLSDHVDAARWLVQHEGVDSTRIGIYGGSYGGFITLMALFTEPDVFRSGAALRAVTDWAHYNHPYTNRILERPQDDSDPYRRSSPIYFAEGFRGDLLIAHGMLDVNVHFQDVVRLVQRLIELRKTGWELAVYPVEGHAFTRPESWTDEYRRILELFERTLRR
jgi:dipeptidyl aminopeptidase/acylaminoacyl peptidase